MDSGDASEMISTTQNAQLTELERLSKALSGWKELLILVQNLLLWKQSYYVYCIGGAVTLLFLFWWWMSVSVITTVAFILFLILLADYLVPSLGSKLLRGKEWDGDQERQFQSVCQQMLDLRDMGMFTVNRVRDFKQKHSNWYGVAVCFSLFILGCVGNCIDNTFLSYCFTLTISLLPGAHHKGMIQRGYGLLCKKVQSIVKSKPKDE